MTDCEICKNCPDYQEGNSEKLFYKGSNTIFEVKKHGYDGVCTEHYIPVKENDERVCFDGKTAENWLKIITELEALK